jgi:hypothetical protein
MTAPEQRAGALAPWLVVVGGFLGAGKTTLLLAAAKELERRGLRSAVVLNDQSDALVDTKYAELNGLASDEVTGGCFCCRFSDLVHALDRMRAYQPDVILAEPVGSCADISATILHPLEEYGRLYRLAPYTVLVDPKRARALLREDADKNLAFLFRKQLEEADLVCFTKADVDTQMPDIGVARVRQISARIGQGVAAWLDEVLYGDGVAGREILDIDYGQYARAEAALAWLNLQVTMRPAIPTTPAAVLGPLLDAIDAALTEAGMSIVHLKAVLRAESGFVKAALCGNGIEPDVEGMLDAAPAWTHELLLNLRCVGDAETAKAIVARCLRDQDAEMSDLRSDAFHPAAPRPERRMSREEIAMRTSS